MDGSFFIATIQFYSPVPFFLSHTLIDDHSLVMGLTTFSPFR